MVTGIVLFVPAVEVHPDLCPGLLLERSASLCPGLFSGGGGESIVIPIVLLILDEILAVPSMRGLLQRASPMPPCGRESLVTVDFFRKPSDF